MNLMSTPKWAYSEWFLNPQANCCPTSSWSRHIFTAFDLFFVHFYHFFLFIFVILTLIICYSVFCVSIILIKHWRFIYMNIIWCYFRIVTVSGSYWVVDWIYRYAIKNIILRLKTVDVNWECLCNKRVRIIWYCLDFHLNGKIPQTLIVM